MSTVDLEENWLVGNKKERIIRYLSVFVLQAASPSGETSTRAKQLFDYFSKGSLRQIKA